MLMLSITASAGAQTPGLANDMLRAHNAVRRQAGVPPLTWSRQLAAHAQAWADSLLARRQFSHTPNSPYGQNLYEIQGATASPERVVKAWADESRNYNYDSNTCHGVCGHYTQIVWSDTKEVGCAVARAESLEIWVCDYNPPGNWVGRRPW